MPTGKLIRKRLIAPASCLDAGGALGTASYRRWCGIPVNLLSPIGENIMSQPARREKKLKEMETQEKFVFFGKLFLFFATFGFAFPTLLID